ncbi:uncharacterized protein LOC141597035 [Silene latifolia]|uniref:uncharacterized protein LOC141597035 n=1 Tax=Silene latifolia TaxID=37657 RepID=UPI003D78A368
MASMQVEKPQRHVYVNMKNHTSIEMLCEKYISFGQPNHPVLLPPIPAGEKLDLGQVVWKGAVVYSGYNKEKEPSAWLLAWDPFVTNGMPSVRKVYVACGSKSVIENMSKEEIEKNLDDASEFSEATDPITKTTANAVIIGASPNDSANVSANFALVN